MPSRTPFRNNARPGVVLPSALLLGVTLVGCTGGPNDSIASPTTSSSISSASPNEDSAPMTPPTPQQSNTPEENQSPEAAVTPIVLEFDGQAIAGELDDSPTAASLVAQLPLTLSFRDFGGQEKLAELPAPLDITGAPDAGTAETSAIGYYVPDQSLILYYDTVGPFRGIVPIGFYDNVDAIVNQTAEFTVTIRAAD